MQLNSKVIEKIADLIEASLSNRDNGHYTIEHDLGPEIVLVFHRDHLVSHWTINQVMLHTTWDIGHDKSLLHSSIARVLINLVLTKTDQLDSLDDMVNGITTNLVWDSPFGITVKFNKDVDSQTFLVCQTAYPNHAIYAFEEAVNTDLSIGMDLLTGPEILRRKVHAILIDYLLADLVTGDLQF